MLTQHFAGSLRLIDQHDHALLSGELARHWRGLTIDERRKPLSFALVLATALHDQPWLAFDREPELNKETQRPQDFLSLPPSLRFPLYRRGLDQLEEADVYTAMLVSLHYTSFAMSYKHADFLEVEQLRRARLADLLRLTPADEERMKVELRYLQFFDLFSLFLCLGGPTMLPASRPPWLWPGNVAKTPTGVEMKLTWKGDDMVVCEPFPFDHAISVSIPYCVLRGDRFEQPEQLSATWAQRSFHHYTFMLIPQT